jgi:nitroreductase
MLLSQESDRTTHLDPDVPLAKVEFFEALRMRRSVRAYEDRPVEEEKLQRILAAANSAPSAGNLQAYEILVVRAKTMKEALAQASCNQTFIAQAPVLLVFCAHPRRSEVKYGQTGGDFFALQDATIACAYSELAAAALGLGTVWIGALDAPKVIQITGIPPAWKPISLLPIGYRAQMPTPTSRRHLDHLVHEIAVRKPEPEDVQ